jgi:hypothetical protein
MVTSIGLRTGLRARFAIARRKTSFQFVLSVNLKCCGIAGGCGNLGKPCAGTDRHKEGVVPFGTCLPDELREWSVWAHSIPPLL